ncbi:hypothetical protein S40288_06864 [Stachybotrys chartarum IBT 40288]|nr:hypothetical protein S40288_06864 [Stachybotrys chartarum IBT 40288]
MNVFNALRPLGRAGSEASSSAISVAAPRGQEVDRVEESSVTLTVAVVAGKNDGTETTTEVEEETISAKTDTLEDGGAELGTPTAPSREDTATQQDADRPQLNGKQAGGKSDKSKGKQVEASGDDEPATQNGDAEEAVNGENASDEATTQGTDEPANDSRPPATQTGAAAATNGEKIDGVFEIDRLASHRVNKAASTVDFEVVWVDAGTSWETERELQQQVPKLVFDYWADKGGRDKVTGLEEYHVFRILEQERRTYRVQWVGYRATAVDTTWESKELLERIAPGSLREWEAQSGKKASAVAAPPAKRGRGRPPSVPRKRIKLTGTRHAE